MEAGFSSPVDKGASAQGIRLPGERDKDKDVDSCVDNECKIPEADATSAAVPSTEPAGKSLTESCNNSLPVRGDGNIMCSASEIVDVPVAGVSRHIQETSISCLDSTHTPPASGSYSSSLLSEAIASSGEDPVAPLLPSLPDDIAWRSLLQVPRSCIHQMRQVSRRWHASVASSEYFAARKSLGLTEAWLYASISDWQVSIGIRAQRIVLNWLP